MFSHLKVATVGALFLGLVVVASTTARGNSEHTNYLTFSRAVSLPGVELAAGTYIFETPTNSMSNSIVRVEPCQSASLGTATGAPTWFETFSASGSLS